MKTQDFSVCKMVAGILLVSLFGFGLVKPATAQSENTPVVTFKGKIIDATTKKPVPFTNIILTGTAIGTISNNEGEFIIKVPETDTSKSISFAYMGYTPMKYTLSELKADKNVISMVPQVTTIQEVIVRTNDPISLINGMLKSISENYGKKPALCTAFYRESVKQNRTYVGVAEAVLDIYMARYNNDFDADRIKVFKGRKSQDLKRMDTLVFKLKGGHHVALLLDLAKNPQSFMDPEYINEYNFQPVTITSIEGRPTYVLEFSRKPDSPDAMYDGKLYIDVSTLAIKKAEFSIDPSAFDMADRLLIVKKPINMKVHTHSVDYSVDYRDLNGRWTLNHVHYQLKFKVNKRHHIFNKIYTSTVDLEVTDKDTVNVTKFKYSQTIKPSDIFIDYLSDSYDENFWGSYNIIKPEEPIEDAVERIGKRMKRYEHH